MELVKQDNRRELSARVKPKPQYYDSFNFWELDVLQLVVAACKYNIVRCQLHNIYTKFREE